ncbi:membrane protein insertase YidC [Curtobacterium sp. MCLR17_036]|uniref:YidC/Oxa1 family membrane protein insertase n=1 Tax=Curtobacterium sp. MCLR17_036 TaxID=2175620 RepID=UPI000DA9F99B|nr:membrane protein insertase YidC [Curtobacterium sp. MCLR17_036]WIE63375.1 membrane protein insertase YidC [Curtobacterium sp. MCLR17_036]
MDLSTLPLVGPLLHGGADLLAALTAALSPVTGSFSAALAVVLVTIAIRAALVPLAVLQVRAERDRRRLAPLLAALRKRHGKDSAALQRAVQELYTNEKVSPLAGCLPVLAQAPVLSLVYALFSHGSIGGTANALLEATLVGVPLGHSLVVTLTSPLWVHAWVVVLLLAVLAVVVELSRRANLRWNPVPPAEPGAAVPGTAAAETVGRIAPFISVVFAAIAPLAAALYVVTSATWTAAERAVLRRAIR